ncbi:hypothetical protein GcM3_042043 [Golovinomyces cichoracearum]|uniref:Uncharacterized protein n=1 Tax=Golovinomyces cichoracearum TaxID=62708 RepID=A0A420J1R3_9PEZI|nr:hypothetical protein GcM3_042043 [Golovinomyces cichoracearum]
MASTTPIFAIDPEEKNLADALTRERDEIDTLNATKRNHRLQQHLRDDQIDKFFCKEIVPKKRMNSTNYNQLILVSFLHRLM